MKVTFSCDKHILGVIPDPVPAIKAAPNYFKKLKPNLTENPKDASVKRCVPFLDALSSGFIIPLWCDVYVDANDKGVHIEFPENYSQEGSLGTHTLEQIAGHPLQETTYGKLPLKWINPWIIKTEPGYSCLFTSPLNHMETRFKLLDGVVDTDTYYNNVNFPFLWTGGKGHYYIEKGTPLVQVIPFLREPYDLQVSEIDQDKKTHTVATLGTRIKNAYREEFWSGKRKEPLSTTKTDADILADKGYVVLPSVLNAEDAATYSQRVIDAKVGDKNVSDGDCLCPNAKGMYGYFDDLLEELLPVISEAAGKRLIPTYSFARLYKKGDDLPIHHDRPSCQYSITLCLGKSNEAWPIYMAKHADEKTGKPYTGEGGHKGFMAEPAAVHLEVGQAVLYRGCDMVHWRDPLEGEWQTQVFLHYVDGDGEYASFKYDNRERLAHHPDPTKVESLPKVAKTESSTITEVTA